MPAPSVMRSGRNVATLSAVPPTMRFGGFGMGLIIAVSHRLGFHDGRRALSATAKSISAMDRRRSVEHALGIVWIAAAVCDIGSIVDGRHQMTLPGEPRPAERSCSRRAPATEERADRHTRPAPLS
jgi:hypothetical protein